MHSVRDSVMISVRGTGSMAPHRHELVLDLCQFYAKIDKIDFFFYSVGSLGSTSISPACFTSLYVPNILSSTVSRDAKFTLNA